MKGEMRMPEDENMFAVISTIVNNEDDISGKYFHVLKCLKKYGLLFKFVQYAEVAHDIFPDKTVSHFFWGFCENLDLLHDETAYVDQQVRMCKDGKLIPFRLNKGKRGIRGKSDNEALKLYLEELSGLDLSGVEVNVDKYLDVI